MAASGGTRCCLFPCCWRGRDAPQFPRVHATSKCGSTIGAKPVRAVIPGTAATAELLVSGSRGLPTKGVIMPGTLPRLIPSVDPTDTVEVQQTTLGTDIVSRYHCNTWEEILANGGAPFDVIVIGAGMFGAYCAEKIYRRGEKGLLRVLVLDAGGHLVSEHAQNLSPMNIVAPGTALVRKNSEDPGTRNRVWGSPWHSDQDFTGLAYCIGGRSIHWGGWSPQLTPADLDNWPAEIS